MLLPKQLTHENNKSIYLKLRDMLEGKCVHCVFSFLEKEMNELTIKKKKNYSR